MEESIVMGDFLAYYKKVMGMQPAAAGSYSPLVLAYIGDAVYEVMIRAKVVNQGNMPVNRMHRKSSGLVRASAQAELIRLLKEELTQEELAVYKRGRNAKSATMAKNATMADYRMATGFEALVGWLFLEERFERLTELVGKGLCSMGVLETGQYRENVRTEKSVQNGEMHEI